MKIHLLSNFSNGGAHVHLNPDTDEIRVMLDGGNVLIEEVTHPAVEEEPEAAPAPERIASTPFKSGIRQLILDRIEAIYENCNKTHFCHNHGVIRGLLWALNGQDPGSHIERLSTSEILGLAGIPNHEEGEEIVWATPGDADWPNDEVAVEIKV